MSKPKATLRPNEDRELLKEYRETRPNHIASTWIEEALNINNQHCSDDAIAVSNLLYLALESIK